MNQPGRIDTPVIFNTASSNERAPLQNFISFIENTNNVRLARIEVEKLQLYFDSLAQSLQADLKEKVAASAGSRSVKGMFERQSVAELESLAQPSFIRKLYTSLAAYTRNTILSGVVVMPYPERGAVQAAFSGYKGYSHTFTIAEKDMTFGFVNICPEKEGCYLDSVTVPYQLLDRKVMADLAPYDSSRLMQLYQKVKTAANHDPLHHLTLPLIVAGSGAGEVVLERSLEDLEVFGLWMEALPQIARSAPYEDWASFRHEKALLSPAGEKIIDGMKQNTAGFFAELVRLRDDMLAGGGDVSAVRENVHYMSMLMAHTLSRVVPLDHPLMQECLRQMEKADPRPGQALMDCYHALGITSAPGLSPEQAAAAISKALFETATDIGRVLNSYLRAGIKIFPAGREMPSYAQLKMVELIAISDDDTRPHAPTRNAAQKNNVLHTLAALEISSNIVTPKKKGPG